MSACNEHENEDWKAGGIYFEYPLVSFSVNFQLLVL